MNLDLCWAPENLPRKSGLLAISCHTALKFEFNPCFSCYTSHNSIYITVSTPLSTWIIHSHSAQTSLIHTNWIFLMLIIQFPQDPTLAINGVRFPKDLAMTVICTTKAFQADIVSRNCFASSIANRMDSGVGICFSCLLGDAPLRPTFPLIFLCHLCTSLLIVTSSRRSALVAPIAESDGHVT